MMEFSKISDRIEILENKNEGDFDAEVKNESVIRPINIEFTGFSVFRQIQNCLLRISLKESMAF